MAVPGPRLADALLKGTGVSPEGASSTPAVAGASASAPPPAAPATSAESEPQRVLTGITQLAEQFDRLVPGRYLLISDLINTARKLLRTFDQVTLSGTQEGLEKLMQEFHPKATVAEIKSALWAAFQEGTAP